MTRYVLAAVAAVMVAGVGAAQVNDFMPDKAKDFGPTPIGPVHTHYFPIENTGKVKVMLGAPRIGCGCVSASVLKGELAPGEKTYLMATMDTKKIPQHQRNNIKTVSVHVPFMTIGLPTQEVKVDVTCTGREDMAMSPDVLAIGEVKKGEKDRTAKVNVTLYGNLVWNVTGITSTGKFVKAEYKAIKGQIGRTDYEVTVTLDEKCPAGNWMSDVFLESATPGLTKFRIPVTVNVKPAIAVEPGALKLGIVPVGAPVGPRPRITLNGFAPFKIIEVKAGDDGQVSAKVVYDGARANHIVELELNPTAVGEFARDIEIVTDNPDMKSVIVPVSATVKK